MIELHYGPTGNNRKVAIMLEEAAIPYRIRHYNIFKGDHLTPEFNKINPNHKIPAIIDHAPADGGEPFAVFESAAILQYLADKSGAFLSREPRERSITIQWLTWQVAGMGPMLGQASHFIRYAPERHEYAVRRYIKESRRLLEVLEKRLSESEYLASQYSIADMAAYPWARLTGLLELDPADFPSIERWCVAIENRPAVQRVYSNPETAVDPSYQQSHRELTEEEWSNTLGDRMLAAVRPK